MRTKRQGLIVWFQNRKHIRQIKKFGNLIYVSKKMRFALIYVNQAEIDEIEETIANLSYVIKVERSKRPFLSTNYENSKPDQAKLYDYKL